MSLVWQLVKAYKGIKICNLVGLRKNTQCYSLRFLRKAPTKNRLSTSNLKLIYNVFRI